MYLCSYCSLFVQQEPHDLHFLPKGAEQELCAISSEPEHEQSFQSFLQVQVQSGKLQQSL